MGKSFDELFNDFFSRRNNNVSLINEEIRKIIDSLMSFKQLENERLNDAIQEELGEPDEIIDHIKMGMRFRKLIWKTPRGQFVKIIVTDLNDESEEKPKVERKKHSKSLEQQLKEAVETENYELAIQLRDQIKDNRKKYRKKKTNE